MRGLYGKPLEIASARMKKDSVCNLERHAVGCLLMTDVTVTIRIPKDLDDELRKALTKAVKSTPKGERSPSRADVFRTMLYRGLEASK
jgi:hypothetical protein